MRRRRSGVFTDVTTDGATAGSPLSGYPDGRVNLADLLFFVNEWTAGRNECP